MLSTTHDQQFILFRVEGETYAVGVNETHEVIRYKQPKRIPHAPAHVLGVINLRGAIIPVVGLRERFSLESKPADDETRVIVAAQNGRLTGLVCDAVERVVAIPAANIEENPDIEQRRGLSAIRGVAYLDEENSVVFLLALDMVLAQTGENVP
ncbi:MAG: chemotaxis protein CheW [Turneriella sp.]